jgi:hypothetical protein
VLANDHEFKLPDGTLARRLDVSIPGGPDGYFLFEFPAEHGHSTFYSDIPPGDAELIEDASGAAWPWMLTRDAETGTARVRRWAPHAADLATSATTSLRLGDRAQVLGWSVEWVGVEPKGDDQGRRPWGTRIARIRSFRHGEPTGAWEYAAPKPAEHDFVTSNGLHRFQLQVVAATLAPDASGSTLVVAGREVDRAAKVAFGTLVKPGVYGSPDLRAYAFPDGLRLVFTKGKSCGIGKAGCKCSETFDTTIEFAGTEDVLALNDSGVVVAAGHTFALRAGNLVVTAAP